MFLGQAVSKSRHRWLSFCKFAACPQWVCSSKVCNKIDSIQINILYKIIWWNVKEITVYTENMHLIWDYSFFLKKGFEKKYMYKYKYSIDYPMILFYILHSIYIYEHVHLINRIQISIFQVAYIIILWS